jgi:hypothetical protein
MENKNCGNEPKTIQDEQILGLKSRVDQLCFAHYNKNSSYTSVTH